MIELARVFLLLCWLMSFSSFALDTLHRGLSPWWLLADLGVSGIGPAFALYLLRET